MARQYFDDGSWIETDNTGTTYAANTEGTVVSKVEADGDFFRSTGYWTDAREATKMDSFTPTAGAGDARPWYERVAEYGLSRAIDNHFGPTTADKSKAGATFAGQNGQTYSQIGAQGGAAGGSWLPVALLAAVAFFALS